MGNHVACESIRFSFALRRWGRFVVIMLQKAVYALNDNQLFLNFILLKMYRKQYHFAQFYTYQINKKTRLFPCKMSSYTNTRKEVVKCFFWIKLM